MDPLQSRSCSAFAGGERVASGGVHEVALACKALFDARDPRTLLVFDDETAYPVELDLRGTPEDVAARHPEAHTEDVSADASPRGAGRPKLGVVGREVTLLPRHWEWLAAQPGGASVTLRKLVEQARKDGDSADRVRRAQEVAYRFMTAIAGDEPGFEEASRALFAGDAVRFQERTEAWPSDVRDHVRRLAEDALSA
jgi:hypothetical protein